MPEFDAQEGSALRRLIVGLGVLAVIGTIAALAVSSTGVADVLPMNANAASLTIADWDSIEAADDALKASAIQVCSAEAQARASVGSANEGIRQAQVDVL